jgi:glycerol-3-phosphate acyltransferase PlsY
MIELGVKITLAYLLGAILGSLLVGHLYGGVDIRGAGSGNPGGTNALRTQGKVFAFWVMLIDVGKGIVAAAFIPPLDIPGVGLDAEVPRALVLYAVALAAVVGHVYPVWFKFRGGKGAATAAGLLCFLAPSAAVFALGAFAAIVFVTGYVGLATISAALVAVLYIGLTVFVEQHALFMFASALAALLIFTHRSNIQRLLAGTESRFESPVVRWRKRRR